MDMFSLCVYFAFRFGSLRLNQQSAFTPGPRLNIENDAQVVVFFCEQESCICRNERSPSRPHKKQDYAPLIKPNYTLQHRSRTSGM